jgi:squalene-hopene/tetraprenyl-beta-curcumene cyclase
MQDERFLGNPDAAQVSRRRFAASLSVAAAAVASAAHASSANSTLPRTSDFIRPQGPYQDSVTRGLDFLRTTAPSTGGVFSAKAPVGVSALAASAALSSGCHVADPFVATCLQAIAGAAQPDGAICSPGGRVANYETCVSILCLRQASSDDRYLTLIQQAVEFLRSRQWDESKVKDADDLAYGGAGYGKRQRPDLSNTVFFVETLAACGLEPSDPAIRKAAIFVSRCQNLESDCNVTSFAAKNPDGGFYYTCAGGGGSAAGATEGGGLQSYAAMTLRGLHALIIAGVHPSDPRRAAATDWLRRNYDPSCNAGLGDAGLYYHFLAFAKAMDALGCWSFEDAQGVSHDWREELACTIVDRQQPNGSWVNSNARWMESEPSLATAYALLALSYC